MKHVFYFFIHNPIFFSYFGMKSPFAISFTKKFLGKVPKHLLIAAGLAATAIDLYCAQTCCILAWEKLPYTEDFLMRDMIGEGWENIFERLKGR